MSRTGAIMIDATASERIWGVGAYKIFLSHKSEVKKETGELKGKLDYFGAACFVAHQDIQPTQKWQDEIESALHSMDAFVALMTDKFHESDWTDQEAGFALARGVPIISVNLGMNPYGFIGKFQALFAKWDTAAVEIMKVLINHEQMYDAYIGALRNCTQWDEGNVLGQIVPGIKTLTEAQVDKMVAAYNETSELQGSFFFRGHKPREYGPGIVSHLNRWSKRKFRYTKNRHIELDK